MNDEAARQGRSDTNSLLADYQGARIAVLQALEALEAGDQWLAVDLLLELADELDEAPVAHRCECTHCGQRFEWPGLLDAHHVRGCPALLRRVRWAA
ncbi:MAG TPA: hypothetical protein VNK94_11680 [Gaiellaceae bacterium]|nr:hypothetical protein [Gaiellaceae bacterium]